MVCSKCGGSDIKLETSKDKETQMMSQYWWCLDCNCRTSPQKPLPKGILKMRADTPNNEIKRLREEMAHCHRYYEEVFYLDEEEGEAGSSYVNQD